MSCAGHLLRSRMKREEIEQLEDEKQRLKTERDCLALTKEIRDWLKNHKIEENTKITFTVPRQKGDKKT